LSGLHITKILTEAYRSRSDECMLICQDCSEFASRLECLLLLVYTTIILGPRERNRTVMLTGARAFMSTEVSQSEHVTGPDLTPGDSLDRLLPEFYAELKQLASLQMVGERADHTLTPTALLHEAYIRLTEHQKLTLPENSRVFLFAAAAETMRRILVEHARTHRRRKQLRQENILEIISADPLVQVEQTDPIEIDSAISQLEKHHPQKAQLVKLRYFAGLTLAQTAGILGISVATANRDWAYARAWLCRWIERQEKDSD
jgi:RNA polymerase sigma factor (TIGR02999 family)